MVFSQISVAWTIGKYLSEPFDHQLQLSVLIKHEGFIELEFATSSLYPQFPFSGRSSKIESRPVKMP